MCGKQSTQCAVCCSQQHSLLPYCKLPHFPWQSTPRRLALCGCHSHTHQIAEETLLGAAAWLERLEGPECLFHGDRARVLLSTPGRPHGCAHRWAQSSSDFVQAPQHEVSRGHETFLKDCLQQHIACMPK